MEAPPRIGSVLAGDNYPSLGGVLLPLTIGQASIFLLFHFFCVIVLKQWNNH